MPLPGSRFDEGMADEVAGGELVELRERVIGAADHQQLVARGRAALREALAHRAPTGDRTRYAGV